MIGSDLNFCVFFSFYLALATPISAHLTPEADLHQIFFLIELGYKMADETGLFLAAFSDDNLSCSKDGKVLSLNRGFSAAKKSSVFDKELN